MNDEKKELLMANAVSDDAGTVSVIHNSVVTDFATLAEALAVAVDGDTVRLNGTGNFTVDGSAELVSKAGVTLNINQATLTATGDAQNLENYKTVKLGAGGTLKVIGNYTLNNVQGVQTSTIWVSGTQGQVSEIYITGLDSYQYGGNLVLANEYTKVYIDGNAINFESFVCNGHLVFQKSYNLTKTLSGSGIVELNGYYSTVTFAGDISNFSGTFRVGQGNTKDKFVFDGENLVYGNVLNVSGAQNGTVELRKAFAGTLNAVGVNVYLCGNTDNLVLGGAVNSRIVYAGTSGGTSSSGRSLTLDASNVAGTVGATEHALGTYFATGVGETVDGSVALTVDGIDFAAGVNGGMGIVGAASNATVNGDVTVTVNSGNGASAVGIASATVSGITNVVVNSGTVGSAIGTVNPAGNTGTVTVAVNGGTVENVYGADLNVAYSTGIALGALADIVITVGNANAPTVPVVTNVSGGYATNAGYLNKSNYRAESVTINVDSGVVENITGTNTMAVSGDVNIAVTGGTVTGDIYLVGVNGSVDGNATITVDAGATQVGNLYARASGASVGGSTSLVVNNDVLKGDIKGFDSVVVNTDTLTVNGNFQLADAGWMLLDDREVLQDGANASYSVGGTIYISEDLTPEEIAAWKIAHNMSQDQDVQAIGTVTLIHNNVETTYVMLKDALAAAVSGDTVRLDGTHHFFVDGSDAFASKAGVTLNIGQATLTATGDAQNLENYKAVKIGAGGTLKVIGNYTLNNVQGAQTSTILVSGTESKSSEIYITGSDSYQYCGNLVLDNEYATVYIGGNAINFESFVCNGHLVFKRSYNLTKTLSGTGIVELKGYYSTITVAGDISNFSGTFILGQGSTQEKLVFNGDNLVYGNAVNVSGSKKGTVELRKALAGTLNADGVNVYLYGNTDNLTLGGAVNSRIIYAGTPDGVAQPGRTIALTAANVIGEVDGVQHALGSFLGTSENESVEGSISLSLTGVDFAHGLRDDIAVAGTALNATVDGNVSVVMNSGNGTWLAGAWGSVVKGKTYVTMNGGTVASLIGVLNYKGGSGDVAVSMNGGKATYVFGADLNSAFNQGIVPGALRDIEISIGNTELNLGTAPVITMVSGGYATAAGSMNLSSYRAESVTINVDAGVIGTIYGSSKLGVNGDIAISFTGGTVIGEVCAGSEYATSTGTTNVVISNGRFNNIYGGGAGSGSSSRAAFIGVAGGTVTGNIYASGKDSDSIYGDATVTVGSVLPGATVSVDDVYAKADGATVKGFTKLVVIDDVIAGDIVGFDNVVVKSDTLTVNGNFQLAENGTLVLATKDTLVKGNQATFAVGGIIYINEVMSDAEILNWKFSKGMSAAQKVVALTAAPVEATNYVITLTDNGKVSVEDLTAPILENPANILIENNTEDAEVRGHISQLNDAYELTVNNHSSLAISGSLNSTNDIRINNFTGAVLNGGSPTRGVVVDAKTITLDNKGQAAVDLTADATIYVINAGLAGLTGAIAGETVTFTGAGTQGRIADNVIAADTLNFNDQQVLENVTLAVTHSVNNGKLTFVGKDTIVSFEAMSGEGWLNWDITGGQAYVNDFALLNAATAAELVLTVNAEQTKGSYTLAGNAASASDMTFTLVGTAAGDAAANLTVGGEAVKDYENHRTYTLTNTSKQLKLNVATLNYANTIFYNSAWTVGEEVSFTYHGEQYSGVVGETGGEVAFFNNYTLAKKETQGTKAIQVVEGGTLTKYQSFDGQNVVVNATGTYKSHVFFGSVGLTESSYNFSGSYTVTVENGTFKKVVAAGDSGTKNVTREGNYTMNITGGVFENYVVGGMAYTSSGTLGSVTHVGNVTLNISGGTFGYRVYGGDLSFQQTAIRTAMIGNVYMTVDSSANVISFGEDITLGSRCTGTVDGSTSITFTGLGSNLVFKKTGAVVNGDSTSAYYSSADHSSMVGYVTGSRTLKFDDFSGEFSAKMQMFTNIAFTGETDVEFTVADSDLRYVSTWDFEYGSVASGLDLNDFTGDRLNFDVADMSNGQWTALSADNVEALSSIWDASAVYFDNHLATKGEECFTYGDFTLSLSDDKKSLVITKGTLA